MINHRSCDGQSFFLFFLFLFYDGTTGIGEENCASLHVWKNRDNFQVSWTWTHSVKFPAIKKVINDWVISKKKASSRRIRIIHVSSLTTGSLLQKQQEKAKSQQLNQYCIGPDLQISRTKRFLLQELKAVPLLGLLPRGCRPKSRSLPGRVEVIQPVVHACTTFWLTSTRITLTRVHRRRHVHCSCSRSDVALVEIFTGPAPFFNIADRHENLYGQSRLYASAQGRHETGGVLSLFLNLSFDISTKNSVQRWSSDFQGLFRAKIRKMALGSNDLSTLSIRGCIYPWRSKTVFDFFKTATVPTVNEKRVLVKAYIFVHQIWMQCCLWWLLGEWINLPPNWNSSLKVKIILINIPPKNKFQHRQGYHESFLKIWANSTEKPFFKLINKVFHNKNWMHCITSTSV